MLDTGGAGIEALRLGFQDAFPERWQQRNFPVLDLGGATDGGLVDFLFGEYGVEPGPENESLFYRHYTRRLESRLYHSIKTRRGRQLPGVLEIVNHFHRSPSCHLGLLTGNIREAAFLKLRVFGYPEEKFPLGAFGDDHADRNRLGPIAIERAENHWDRAFHPQQVLIIGDTVKDIRCGRACGARVMSVATGASSYETLREAQPDFLYRDFSDFEGVIRDLDERILGA